MKTYRGSRGTAPLILNLGTDEVVNFMSRPLCTREINRQPLELARLVTEPVWAFWIRKKFLPLVGI